MLTFPQYRLEDLEAMRPDQYTHLLALAERANIELRGVEIDVMAPIQMQLQLQEQEQG